MVFWVFFFFWRCFATCVMSVSQPELNLSHWHWRLTTEVLTTRPPGNFLVEYSCGLVCSPEIPWPPRSRRWGLWEIETVKRAEPPWMGLVQKVRGEFLVSFWQFISLHIHEARFLSMLTIFCSVGRNSKEKNSPCSQIPKGHNWCFSCWYNGQEESETWS